MSGLLNFSKARIALMLIAVAALAGGTAVRADDSKLLSKDELKTLVFSAKTPEDHQRLAAHFNAKADQLESDAKDHTELAAKYKANPTIHEMKHPMSGATYGHCEYFATTLHKASLEARKLAADHEEMAKQSK